jgi:RNA polymerase sigma-70 factor (sigma-E family)
MPALSFVQFASASLPALTRYARALTGGAAAGDDLVQDTLVKVWGSWWRVRDDGNPLAYARAVMFRTYVSRWRSLRRRPEASATSDVAATDDQYATVDERDELRRALAALPRPQRAVLVLTYLDGMPDDEIATLLDRRPATIRSLRYRGLQALRERLTRHDWTEASHGQS